MTLLSFGGKTPAVDPTAFVAPGARLIGDIEIGPEASIWYNCVLRGDVNAIRIGARIQHPGRQRDPRRFARARATRPAFRRSSARRC